MHVFADTQTTFSGGLIALLVVLAIWELVWKCLALWRAAKRDDLVWFIIIVVINSVGILPIIYLLLTNKKSKA